MFVVDGFDAEEELFRANTILEPVSIGEEDGLWRTSNFNDSLFMIMQMCIFF